MSQGCSRRTQRDSAHRELDDIYSPPIASDRYPFDTYPVDALRTAALQSATPTSSSRPLRPATPGRDPERTSQSSSHRDGLCKSLASPADPTRLSPPDRA